MISKQIIAYLKLLHGSYNAFIIVLFVYHGLNGLKIRRNRIKGKQDLGVVKRHRKLGPVLALLGISGFFAGLTLIYLDKGRIMEYPIHFITGLTIALAITATYFISRKIKGDESKIRTIHFLIGILIICLYLFQAFLGLGILL
jgi:hypothetical protein